VIPSAGEVWLADRGDETRRLVVVISDDRFQRLADRAVVAPVLEAAPTIPRPWHIDADARWIAANHLGTVALDRLLERVDQVSVSSLREIRTAVRHITGA
jgi:mRNA-degrading endonuclease toxin of MazEF toxin-antitoxin module